MVISASARPIIVVTARFVILALFCVIGLGLIQAGLSLRHWVWVQTDPIHFYPDMNNGIHWGSQGNEPAERPRGFLNVYDLVANSAQKNDNDAPEYGLDYAPLRLLLITRWQRWAGARDPEMMRASATSAAFPRNSAWHPTFASYGPLLRFNEITELFAALGLFLLTRHWVLRGDRRWGSTCRAGDGGAITRPFRGCGAGALAAMLFWFNPAVILSTHGWPTWDEWIIPFFVWTLWLCCVDWWFTAGVVLAIGAMFKGQQFFVAPTFILLPLLLGRPLAALRWTAGLALGISLIAAPWLLSYVPGGVTAQTTPADRRIDWPASGFVMVSFVLLAMPVLGTRILGTRRLGARWARFKIPHFHRLGPAYWPFAALAIAAALLLCARWFHGSLNWAYIGWGYGTRHYLNMVTGLSDNLAGLLSNRFGWTRLAELVFTFRNYPITIRTLLVLLYGLMLIICIVGMSIQYRRNDPKFLVAATGAWLMFFAFLPQIHERYLLYAAGVGCSLAAVSFGFVLLDLFLTALTFMMTLHVMLTVAASNRELSSFAKQISPTFSRSLFAAIGKTYPDAGWALLFCAAVFLYHTIAPSPSIKQR